MTAPLGFTIYEVRDSRADMRHKEPTIGRAIDWINATAGPIETIERSDVPGRGAEFWMVDVNGRRFDVLRDDPLPDNRPGSLRYRELCLVNRNRPTPLLVCPRCEQPTAFRNREEQEHPGVFDCYTCRETFHA